MYMCASTCALTYLRNHLRTCVLFAQVLLHFRTSCASICASTCALSYLRTFALVCTGTLTHFPSTCALILLRTCILMHLRTGASICPSTHLRMYLRTCVLAQELAHVLAHLLYYVTSLSLIMHIQTCISVGHICILYH